MQIYLKQWRGRPAWVCPSPRHSRLGHTGTRLYFGFLIFFPERVNSGGFLFTCFVLFIVWLLWLWCKKKRRNLFTNYHFLLEILDPYGTCINSTWMRSTFFQQTETLTLSQALVGPARPLSGTPRTRSDRLRLCSGCCLTPGVLGAMFPLMSVFLLF